MTQNPYSPPADNATTESHYDADGSRANNSGKYLDFLSRLTVISCLVLFGMMVLGRLFDENAEPIRSDLPFFFVFSAAPGLSFFGALSSLKRRRYGVSVIGALCTSIPVFGPCFGLMIPVGIWTLILLRNPAIREEFNAAVTENSNDPNNADDAIAHAARLETIGEWDAAIAAYHEAANRWPEHATYIKNCVAEIDKKQSATT